MRFILARHCTTDWNAVGKIQGSANRNLTAKGLEEAQQLAENLKDMGITKIVSSTLNRAMQTAVVVNSVLNVEKDLDVRLRECAFGKIEGLTIEEAKEQFSDVLSEESFHGCKCYDYRPVGGESYDAVLKRYIQVLEDCRQKFYEDDVVLLVGHGWAFCTLFTAFGEDEPKMQRGEYKILEY